VNETIAPKLRGFPADQQEEIDDRLRALDGTESKKNLGANAILGSVRQDAHFEFGSVLSWQ
jgi:enolase